MMKHLSEFNNKEIIKLVLYDFDGVFTDNNVIVDEKGHESVFCSRYDGYGIEKLRKKEISQFVITSEIKPIANRRCEKLGITCINNVKSKLIESEKIIKNLNLKYENVCFIGNDINDIDLLDKVGFPIKTIDSHPELNNRGYFSTKISGGKGCVRELADFLTS